MNIRVFSIRFIVLTMAALLIGTSADIVNAQSGGRSIEPDHDLDMFVPRSGRILTPSAPVANAFPGSHFFPGPHFTQRYLPALERQGIRTVANFLQTDAATIARTTGLERQVVIRWQQELRQRTTRK